MLDELAVQGILLVDAARQAGTATRVPTCPEWTVADLMRHVGEVHRWAAAIVATAAHDELDSLASRGDLPADAGLADWVAEGHQALVEALRAAPADLDCWHFLGAPSPLAFWARRQLHETAVHRMDAETAAGTAITPVPDSVAEDGIDELLTGFLPRSCSRLRSEQPRSLLVLPEHSAARWWVSISSEKPETVREERAADEVVRGYMGELYAGLWNRGPLDADPELLALWRSTVSVRWS